MPYYYFAKRHRVSLLMVGVALCMLTPPRTSAMEAGALHAQTGAAATHSGDRNPIAEHPSSSSDHADRDKPILEGAPPAAIPPAVEGVIVQLNSPGSITVVISLGTDDGVKSGTFLAILRNGKRIGRLKVAKAERDRSTASISAVEDVKALEVGDRVTNNELPAGPRVPDRQPPPDRDVQGKQEVPTGTLSGRFVYDGEPPVAKDLFPSFAELDIDKPQERGPDGRFSGVEAVYREYLKHKIRPTTIDQSLRVGKDKGLADVVLWVASEDIPWTPSAENQLPVTIQINNASFSPPATAVIAGQSVIIENQDLVDQSVSAMFSRALSPPFNALLKARSTESSIRMVFPVPEPFPARISLQHCPWASGLLFVHSNPYVAISREDGSFRIPNLPLGQWEFQAWHPRSGYISDWPGLRGPRKKGRFTQKITLGDNRLAPIKLPPELFKVRNAVDKTSLLGQWKLVAKATGGEPVDKSNFDGMRWTLGKETLDILPASSNRAGATKQPMPKSRYTIDNAQSPPHFNWTFGEGKMSLEIAGIYELKDEVLRVCVPQQGEPRPTGFETTGQKWTVYVFKRVLED